MKLRFGNLLHSLPNNLTFFLSDSSRVTIPASFKSARSLICRGHGNTGPRDDGGVYVARPQIPALNRILERFRWQVLDWQVISPFSPPENFCPPYAKKPGA